MLLNYLRQAESMLFSFSMVHNKTGATRSNCSDWKNI